MSQNKKSRKKTYRPGKAAAIQLFNDARQCRLFRWEGGNRTNSAFDIWGPFAQAKCKNLMTEATKRNEKWLVMVTAYFLGENDDYYEEALTFDPMGTLVLASHRDDLVEMLDAAMADAKASGNQEHYQNTCATLFLYTPELAAKLEDDDWIKAQAEVRAELIHDDLRGTG